MKKKKKVWTALSEVRHVTPKSGFAFKDRRRKESNKRANTEVRKYLGFLFTLALAFV